MERILVRYERLPIDFYDLLEPVYLNLMPRSDSPGPMTRRLSMGTLQRPTNGAFMTLARYLKHERWIWHLHEGQRRDV